MSRYEFPSLSQVQTAAKQELITSQWMFPVENRHFPHYSETMKLTFIGAARCVTGSCTLVEHDNLKILIDCGLAQGNDAKQSATKLPFRSNEIDYVFLTHAHVDHCGRLPLLVKDKDEKQRFHGKILCTKATTDLCNLLIPDSAGIQEYDATWQNRQNAKHCIPKQVQPLYTAIDAQEILKSFVPVEYHKRIALTENLTVTLADAGHMLGSASVIFEYEENGTRRSLVFSGDIGNLSQPIIKDPEYIASADYVVMESTYGDRNHTKQAPSTEDLAAQLEKIIDATFARGGKVIIPAFAVGRSQELLFLLRHIAATTGKKLPTYLDSPLAVQATAAFVRNSIGYYDEETLKVLQSGKSPILFSGFQAITETAESKALNDIKESCIIITSSSMCEAGRIRHHLRNNISRKENTIVFTGYQAPDTLGEKILSGQSKVTIFGESLTVNAQVTRLDGISGHADQTGLLRWLESLDRKPEKVFAIHGDRTTSTAFAALLRQKGYNASAPATGHVEVLG